MKQKDLIHKRDWDVLFLLDSVRYDYFKKFTEDLLDGETKKVTSPCTWSLGWLIETFDDNPRKDIVFLSPDDSVNANGKMPRIMDNKERKRYEGCKGDLNEYFYKIINVWEYGRDKEYGLVYPETMCDETEKYMKKYPNKKIITNFFQIHDPYIYFLERGEKSVMFHGGAKEWTRQMNKYVNLKRLASKFLSDETIWSWRKRFGSVQPGSLSALWMKYGRQGIRNAYVYDLRYVISYIKLVMTRNPNKRYVITSDHGERLGEKGNYGHGGKREESVVEVPWFEIQKNNAN